MRRGAIALTMFAVFKPQATEVISKLVLGEVNTPSGAFSDHGLLRSPARGAGFTTLSTVSRSSPTQKC